LPTSFCQVFDGYSIGSNDLTQLTLGLDRDSEMVAHLFDERNGAVERNGRDGDRRCPSLRQEDRDLRSGDFDYPNTPLSRTKGITSILSDPRSDLLAATMGSVDRHLDHSLDCAIAFVEKVRHHLRVNGRDQA